MQQINPDFKPPPDYKYVPLRLPRPPALRDPSDRLFARRPPIIRVHDKVMIPQEEHPDINFVGLLIGPRGNTLKGE